MAYGIVFTCFFIYIVIEVTDLTLLVGSNLLHLKRQADHIPSLGFAIVQIHELIRCALVPHTIAAHVVFNRTVKVLLIHKQMVVSCRWLTISESCLYEMTVYCCCWSYTDTAIAVVESIIAILRLSEITTIQHSVGLLIGVAAL